MTEEEAVLELETLQRHCPTCGMPPGQQCISIPGLPATGAPHAKRQWPRVSEMGSGPCSRDGLERELAAGDVFASYLDLERAALRLEDRNEALADRVRDAMDPIWRALSDAERACLNNRKP